MPAIGDQHKPCALSANPFEEVKPHIHEYTAQEIATLSSRLDKQLGPEYISSRPGAGGQKVHYLAAEKCINLANEVFGFNGWSSAVRDLTVDFIDELPTGKISLGLSVIVRVTLRDGSYHEDIGYGHIENCKGKAAAFEKAKKEGTTDALKRTLRNFGNILGNCLYDREYLGKVTKLKVPMSKWDAEDLHRHPQYANVKKEPVPDISEPTTSGNDSSGASLRETDDEFGEADFDEADFGVGVGEHPDEIVLDAPNGLADFNRREPVIKKEQATPLQRTSSSQGFQQRQAQAPQRQPVPLPTNNTPQNSSAMPNPSVPYQTRNGITGQPSNLPPQRFPQPANNQYGSSRQVQSIGNQNQSGGVPGSVNSNIPNLSHQGPLLSKNNIPNNNSPQKPSNPPELEPLVGFFSSKVADSIQNNRLPPPNVPLFNPKAESPSIRKTQGVDHTKTKPVHRETLVAPTNNPLPQMRSNFVHPQADQTRRIGAPTIASPLQNRGSYKPPQMNKRPLEGNTPQFNRSALNDVTANSVNTPMDSGGTDNKRPKLENGQGPQPNGHNVIG